MRAKIEGIREIENGYEFTVSIGRDILIVTSNTLLEATVLERIKSEYKFLDYQKEAAKRKEAMVTYLLRKEFEI